MFAAQFAKKLMLASLASVAMFSALSIFRAKTVEAQVATEVKVFSSASVEVYGMSRKDLFDFVSNIENDQHYWVGVVGAEIVKPGKNGKLTGQEYIQRGEINGYPFETYITIKRAVDPVLMIHEGQGGLNYTAVYTITNTRNGAKFTSTSVSQGVGLTPESITGYLQYSFQGLLAYLGKQGEVTIHGAYEI